MGIEEEIYGLETPEQPGYLAALNNIPGMFTTTGWNINRVTNTIFNGDKKTLLPRVGRKGIRRVPLGRGRPIAESFRQTFSPRRFFSLSSAANINPASRGIYSPFNVLSNTGNFLFKHRNVKLDILGEKANTYINSSLSKARTAAGAEEGKLPFSAGVLGRIAAADKMMRMDKISAKQFKKFSSSYLAMTGEALSPGMGGIATAGKFLNTIDGSISGKAAGYIYGSSAARMGAREAAIALDSTSGVVKAGANLGIDAFRAGSTLAKAASYAGPALRVAGGLGTAAMIHDIGMLIGRGIGGAIKIGAGAMQSVKGSIDKPIMGMGFKDNTIAATSRQRGVMAIQNSRLNARSVLGSEASALAAHFG